MDIQPVKRTSLSDDLVERLMHLIKSDAYTTGDRLPSIAEMTSRLQVGHPTLREALRKLEVIGIIEIKHGSGIYIKRDPDILLVSNPVFGGAVSKKLLLDLIEARAPIEMQAAQLAAIKASDTHLEKLTDLMQKAAANLDDDNILNVTNLSFHYEIAAASGNKVLTQMLEVLNELFKDEQRLILDIYGDRKRDHEEHLEILDALRKRDGELAKQCMEKHLAGVREVLLLWDPEHTPLS